ncbi:MAG: AAA family ATPase [Lachnospiraceae bacterium]|nr:AAA family ATPase [Lachnospiraceae bacterium]
MRKIAIYGKGGIGKSTTTCNLSAALSHKGYRVMQIGCDPKSDSTKNLMRGVRIPTVLEQLKQKGEELTLEGLRAFEVYQPDIVIYDVLGDVVCGDVVCSGFAMPIRGGYAKDVYVVSSGEMMALYAANNIAAAIRNFGKRGYARLRGLILNARNIENEVEIVQEALKEIGTGSLMRGFCLFGGAAAELE